MKKYLVLALIGFFVSGCSSTITKRFKVITDPPDADVSVVSGVEFKELKYRSPAAITVKIPKDPALAAKAVLEVRKDSYKPRSLALRDIKDGDSLTVTLEKLIRYRLKYRLVAPVQASELRFQDKSISISVSVGEQTFQMSLTNLTSYPMKILWERAEYTDVNSRPYRIMHSGIAYPNRNNLIPDQVVQSGGSVQEAVIPVKNVYMSQQKKGYDLKPLFTLDTEAAAGLKGRTFNLFIPVEVNRQIIPYNFKIAIEDARRE